MADGRIKVEEDTMTSTLIVNENVAWMPTASAFEFILDLIIRELEAHNDESVLSKLDQNEPYYLELTTLPNNAFKKMLLAAEEAFEHIAIKSGNEYGLDQQRFRSRLILFSQLKALMKDDPRIEKEREVTGRLVISTDLIWTAKNPWFDMVLENLALRVEDDRVAKLLLDARLGHGNTSDLKNLTDSQFHQFLAAVEFLHERHGQGIGPGMKAFEFFETLGSYVVELHRMATTDSRAQQT
jgi:hypothetical protein